MSDDLAAQMNARVAGTLMEHMGIVITELVPGRVAASMPVAGNTQPYGLLHGGASAALAETVGSYAANLHAGPGYAAVGVELNCTHHRAVKSGSVHAVATPLHEGRTMATYEIVIVDDDDHRICTSRLTCYIMKMPS